MYNNCVLHMDKRVTKGVHSSTGAAVDEARRAVFCGAQAGLLAFGRDYGALDRFKWVESLFDYENQLGVSAGLVFGMKKTVFNSKDFATIVIATRAEQH